MRLRRDVRAATAVEFALIGSYFFLIIFAIVVIAIDMFWQLTLDDAVRNATRQVQIGEISTKAKFVTAVCDEFSAVAPGCTTSLQYEVYSAPSFTGAGGIAAQMGQLQPTGNLSDNGAWPASLTSSSSSIPLFLLVQVAYPLPFKIFAVPNGVATENGTSSLYSVVTTVMEP